MRDKKKFKKKRKIESNLRPDALNDTEKPNVYVIRASVWLSIYTVHGPSIRNEIELTPSSAFRRRNCFFFVVPAVNTVNAANITHTIAQFELNFDI